MSDARARLAELIAAHLAGELTDDQRSELNVLLKADPDARAEFASALRRDVLLGEILRDEAAVAGTEPASRPAARSTERDSKGFRRAPLSRRATSSSWAPAIAAAALFTGAIGLVVFLSTPPEPRSVVVAPPSVPAESRPKEVPPSNPPAVPAPAPIRGGDRKPIPVEPVPGRGAIERIPELVQKPEPKPEPEPTTPPVRVREGKEPPAKRPLSPPPTVSTLAVVERIEGEAFVVKDKSLVAAPAGTRIGAGQGFRTLGANSAAVITFEDGTTLGVTGDTRVGEFSAKGGKRLVIEQGRLRLDVAKQPAGAPLVVATPHCEVRVLGTRFTVNVAPGDRGTSRVAVQSGKVQVAAGKGGRVELRAGRYTVAGPSVGRLREGRVLHFQDGVHPVPAYAGTRDTYIEEGNPSNNFNHQKSAHVDALIRDGVRLTLSGLLRWDLQGIPKGSRVHAVTVALQVQSPTRDRYGLYALRRPWSEAEVTWNMPDKNGFWQERGARGPRDRETGAVGSFVPNRVGINECHLDPAGVALVQSWIEQPSRNHGFVFAGSETGGWIFTTRESDVLEHRPRITVYFQPPGRR